MVTNSMTKTAIEPKYLFFLKSLLIGLTALTNRINDGTKIPKIQFWILNRLNWWKREPSGNVTNDFIIKVESISDSALKNIQAKQTIKYVITSIRYLT